MKKKEDYYSGSNSCCNKSLFMNTADSYSQTTALLRQKGRTLDFAMAIGGILEFAVPLLRESHISYY